MLEHLLSNTVMPQGHFLYTTGTFLKAECDCGTTSEGQYCESPIDVCNSCYNVSNCNISATNPCGECPSGFYGLNGEKCFGKYYYFFKLSRFKPPLK